MARREGEKIPKEKVLDLARELSGRIGINQHMAGEAFCTELGEELSEISEASKEEIDRECATMLRAV